MEFYAHLPKPCVYSRIAYAIPHRHTHTQTNIDSGVTLTRFSVPDRVYHACHNMPLPFLLFKAETLNELTVNVTCANRQRTFFFPSFPHRMIKTKRRKNDEELHISNICVYIISWTWAHSYERWLGKRVTNETYELLLYDRERSELSMLLEWVKKQRNFNILVWLDFYGGPHLRSSEIRFFAFRESVSWWGWHDSCTPVSHCFQHGIINMLTHIYLSAHNMNAIWSVSFDQSFQL